VKVALVTQQFAPELEGGTERVVAAQARALRAAGHQPRVVCGTARAHAGTDVEHSSVAGLQVARLPRRDSERFDLGCAWPRLAELAREAARGCDLAWVHHWSTLGSGLVRAFALDMPVVLWLHDAFAACPRFFRASPIAGLACPRADELAPCVTCLAAAVPERTHAWLAGELAGRRSSFRDECLAAARVVAPSAFLARRLAASLGLEAGAIRVLPHCAWMPERTLPALPREPWSPSRPLRVLHCGHLSRAKGILDLVHALSSLPRGSARLDLAGSVLEDDLRSAVLSSSAGLDVRFHGAYDSQRLEELALQADLAAFPSRLEESYGLVVDEACDLGLPVWVSERGALPERLAARGGAGRVLPAGDPAAWTRAFAELLERPATLAAERARLVPRAWDARALERVLDVARGPSPARA
jgi:glycosyltransferase involved in cell wall biosynthesis